MRLPEELSLIAGKRPHPADSSILGKAPVGGLTAMSARPFWASWDTKARNI
jgi:hypothetical protein